MEKYIFSTAEELTTLIETSIKKALSQKADEVGKGKELPEILNVDQAAEFLSLAKQTLYGFTSKGEIPYLKRGKKLYFKKSELEAWVNEGRKQ